MKTPLAAGAIAAALLLVANGGASTHRGSGAPPGLSSQGKLLWNFEALLHDRFGNGRICASVPVNFSSGSCAPLAKFLLYRYVFPQARRSPYHVASGRVGGFGNYPTPVLIRGRPIACDARERRFLIHYRSAISLTLEDRKSVV